MQLKESVQYYKRLKPARVIFGGFKILNFIIFGSFQKNEFFFFGMKILWIFFGVITKLDYI